MHDLLATPFIQEHWMATIIGLCGFIGLLVTAIHLILKEYRKKSDDVEELKDKLGLETLHRLEDAMATQSQLINKQLAANEKTLRKFELAIDGLNSTLQELGREVFSDIHSIDKRVLKLETEHKNNHNQ